MFFNSIIQKDQMSCGSTCLAMICQHHGKRYTTDFLDNLCAIGKQGMSLLNISKAAESIGFRTLGIKITVEQFIEKAITPCILHWNNQHFVVAYKASKNKIKIADPKLGKLTLSREEFLECWQKTENQEGFALLLEPTDSFYQTQDSFSQESHVNGQFSTIINKLKQYKPLLGQLIIGIFAITLINLIIPFLSQALIDQGVNQRDFNFISLVLIAQLCFIFSRTAIEFIRSWILLHISSRVNISILADFLQKLFKLPLSYYDKKNTGDILQRIGDHQRIEQFLTSHSLNTIFSMINLLVFGVVLWIYNAHIFLVFLIGSSLGLIWPLLFLKRRKKIDAAKFAQSGNHQNNLLQMIYGMPEIKINQATQLKTKQWSSIQLKLFSIKINLLKIEQLQQAGTILINEIKNLLVIFVAAKLVIAGDITIGTLVAITYILGQLNGPIEQLLGFIPIMQNASLSLKRLTEVQSLEEEKENTSKHNPNLIGDIKVTELSFAYPGFQQVLNNININIASNQTTAIVGESGSGKSTLLKLLLKFYQTSDGQISINNNEINRIGASELRKNFGVVFQDSYIFDDTIAANVGINTEQIDYLKLESALRIANLLDDIQRLPLSWDTVIGQNGQINLSKGQQQRLMIARAIYKDPEYIFFDEATSALDANNEKVIQDNLNHYLKSKTAIIIAHRLSTVKNADQIIVLKQGRVVESGKHNELVSNRADYFHLVKNQLELGA